MGIEATLAGAMASLPEIRLPDGRVYELRPMSLRDLLRVRRQLQAGSEEATSLHVYLRIAATLTGASREVIALMHSDADGQIVSLAQEAVHTLASAMQEAAPSSPTPASDTGTPLDLAEVGVNVARVYGLPFTTVLEWSAADVLIAAWSIGRAATSEQYRAHTLVLYAANLTAVAFHEPQKLSESARSLEAHAPAWEQPEKPTSAGSWDDLAAMATKMGAG